MTNDRPLILITGNLIDQAVMRIGQRFDHLQIAASDPQQVSSEDRLRVRGLAAGMTGVSADVIDAFPALEIIASYGVGYDGVDAVHAASRGIMVTNTPDVLTEEVADTAIALLLNTLRGFSRAETWLRAGRWVKDGAYPLSPGTLRNRRIGIFGMGRIGLAIARRLEGFDVALAYHNRRKVEDVDYPYYPTLQALAEACDVLINVAPSTPQTAKAVDAGVLQALGPDGVLINIGRGATVDEAALIEALQTKTIFAAGLDVFDDEPHVPQALLEAETAVLLPHVGSASVHTRVAMADLLVDNLESWFEHNRAVTPVPETRDVKRRV